jgi:hypothetical protein
MSPQGQAEALPAGDPRPVVRTSPTGNRALWIFAALLLIVAVLLFEALNARREQLSAPATQALPSNGAMVTAPPPLVLPPQFQTAPQAAYPNLAPGGARPGTPGSPRAGTTGGPARTRPPDAFPESAVTDSTIHPAAGGDR